MRKIPPTFSAVWRCDSPRFSLSSLSQGHASLRNSTTSCDEICCWLEYIAPPMKLPQTLAGGALKKLSTVYSVFATNCKYSCRLEFLRENTDVGRRSVAHRLCSLVNFDTRKTPTPTPDQTCGHPGQANGLLKDARSCAATTRTATIEATRARRRPARKRSSNGSS